MMHQEIQQQIQENVESLLKGSPETLKALATRAHEAEQNVAYFLKLGDKGRVRYEMCQFLHWLKKYKN